MKAVITTERHTDDEVRKAIATLFEKYGYVADPHTAIGYLGVPRETHRTRRCFSPPRTRRNSGKSCNR